MLRNRAKSVRLMAAVAAVACLSATGASAQTSTSGASTSGASTGGTSTGGATTTTTAGTTTEKSNAPGGSLEKSHHDWRSSKLVGATVYDTAGDSIGTVDDLLVSGTGQVVDVVLSVGGFLGIGDKLVEVPFSKLSFKPSSSSGKSGPADYSLVLPNASKASLKTMAGFTY